MNTKYYKGIFISYKDGYYHFVFEDGVDIVFEEVHNNILLKYNLKSDVSLMGNLFHLSYSEKIADDDEDLLIYKLEYLELINTN